MKAKIKIPKGWRKLRRGETVLATDRYWIPGRDRWWPATGTCITFVGDKVGDNYGDLDVQPFIRRLPKRRTSK